MQTFIKAPIFRTFYANDWNQPELIAFQTHPSKLRKLFPQMRKNCVNSNSARSKRTD
jgi:hypothetical protein